MAVAMMLGGAVVNALAFSGSNFIFSMFGNRRVDEEKKRHDLAIENLQRARDAWTQKRTERIDFINEELRKQQHAVSTFRDVDNAMREYYRVTGQNLEPLEKEPVMSDFYEPSTDQINRELIFMTLGLGGTGYLIYSYIL